MHFLKTCLSFCFKPFWPSVQLMDSFVCSQYREGVKAAAGRITKLVFTFSEVVDIFFVASVKNSRYWSLKTIWCNRWSCHKNKAQWGIVLAAGLQLACFASTRTFLIVCDNFWHLVSIIVWCQDFGAPTPLHPPKKTTTTNFVWWSCQVKKRPPLRPLLWWFWTSNNNKYFFAKILWTNIWNSYKNSNKAQKQNSDKKTQLWVPCVFDNV